MEFSTMVFYSKEVVEQINYLAQVSRIAGEGKAIKKTNSPYIGVEHIIDVVDAFENKSEQIEFSLGVVKKFIKTQKEYKEKTGKVNIYGEKELLGFFLANDAFTYGGK